MADKMTILILFTFLLATTVLASEELAIALRDGKSNSRHITLPFVHRDHETLAVRETSSATLKDRMSSAAKRSHARSRSLPQHSAAQGIDVKVYGKSGEYMMIGALGTPPTRFVAIVDTGSSPVFLQCKQCVNCFEQVDRPFDPTNSSSFETLPCSSQFCEDLPCGLSPQACLYSYQYGDGSSTDGYLATETFRLGTSTGKSRNLTDIAFGCALNSSGTFGGTADGIAGFGLGKQSLPAQIASAVGNEFSYCLGDFAAAINQTSTLILGADLELNRSHVKFTPLVRNSFFPDFYYVQLKSIKVGGQRLAIPRSTFQVDTLGNGGMILDSGTTLTFLPQAAYDAVVASLLATVTYPPLSDPATGLQLCFNFSGTPNPTFPTIAFHFKGVTLKMSQDNTFIGFDTEVACLAMGASQNGLGIFGNYQQQNFRLLFDLAGSQIGFMKEQCYSSK